MRSAYIKVTDLTALGFPESFGDRLLARYTDQLHRDPQGAVFVKASAVRNCVSRFAREFAPLLPELAALEQLRRGQVGRNDPKGAWRRHKAARRHLILAPLRIRRRSRRLAPFKNEYFGPDAKGIQGDWNSGEQPEFPTVNSL